MPGRFDHDFVAGDVESSRACVNVNEGPRPDCLFIFSLGRNVTTLTVQINYGIHRKYSYVSTTALTLNTLPAHMRKILDVENSGPVPRDPSPCRTCLRSSLLAETRIRLEKMERV